MGSQSDLDFLDNRVLPAANQFDHFFDNLAHNNDGVFEDSHFDEFLNRDDQPAPEIQSSDSLAEKTTSLQPPFGASTFGCDDGFSECGNTHDVTLGDPCYRKGEQTGRTKAGRSCGGKTVRRVGWPVQIRRAAERGFVCLAWKGSGYGSQAKVLGSVAYGVQT